jgi:RNA polymerase sigma-70 factor (ECF subfamily)
MADNDAAVVATIIGGDRDAYRILMDRYARGVFRLAYRMTGNEEDANEVVQETFLRAYKQLQRWESRSSFSTWLYRIAANYSIDMTRQKRKRSEISLTQYNDGGEVVDISQYMRSDEPGPDRLLDSSRLKECVSTTLNELSGQERTAFVLRHFEDQSIDQISSALGLSANATKQSIFRAVKKLRRALEPLVSPVKVTP